MSFTGQLAEQEQFRVVLILPWSQMVLVEQHGETRRLPRISIPRWTRTAEQLTKALQVRWTVRSIVIDLLPRSYDLPQCAVVEVRSRDWNFALAGFTPVQVGNLDEQELTTTERLTVSSIVVGDTEGRGPFSRLGWVEEAQAWIRESVIDRRVDFTEDVRQFTAGGFFALVRFGTLRGPAYWLKATGSPNAHELAVTQALARYSPDFVPPLIATRADWNAWVTEEVGLPLRDVLSLHSLEQSTHCLAGLQITSGTYVNDLLACGCFDQRSQILRTHLPELIQYLENAMARQTSTRVPPLEAVRLHGLGHLLETACSAMESIGIPDTLIHNDINLRNALFDGERTVFTDWSEACIGCPFLTFQHLWVQAVEADQTQIWASRVRATYKSHWACVLSESQIERALSLCPPIAIASFLYGRDISFTSPCRSLDQVQSYARSLARHMDRAVRTPDFLEALCN